MMKIAYFDCFSGVSGDMILGALVDAGLSLTRFRRELKKIPLKDYTITQHPVKRGGISATKIDIVVRPGRTGQGLGLARMISLIKKSRLEGFLRTRIIGLLERLGKAEARVHGIKSPKDYRAMHLHELGSADTLLDIAGVVIGLHLLGVARVFSSALPINRGFVETGHGRMPTPAPATAELMCGWPTFYTDVIEEIVTPTGALLITSLAQSVSDPVGEMPLMSFTRIGYGAGKRELASGPNLLRVFLGKSPDAPPAAEAGQDAQRQPARPNARLIPFGQDFGRSGGTVWVIETNLDDTIPEVMGYLFDRLFKGGALDVFTTPVQMKKSRPGLLLTVLASQKNIARIEEIIYNETTTFGVRRYPVERDILERKTYLVTTRYGKVRVKVGWKGREIKSIAPEYEDCRRIATSGGLPLKQVYQMVWEKFKITKAYKNIRLGIKR